MVTGVSLGYLTCIYVLLSWYAGDMQLVSSWCPAGMQVMCSWCSAGMQMALFPFLFLTLSRCLVVPVHLGWAGHCFHGWTPRSAQLHGNDPRRNQVSGLPGVSAWQPTHEVR